MCDLDGDGVLTATDLRPFYDAQLVRMAAAGMELIKFEDVLCQFADLLQPRTPGRFLLGDFTHAERVKLTGVLFSALVDLDKFQRFEGRECVRRSGVWAAPFTFARAPLLTPLPRSNPPSTRRPCLVKQGENYAISQWDRFATLE